MAAWSNFLFGGSDFQRRSVKQREREREREREIKVTAKLKRGGSYGYYGESDQGLGFYLVPNPITKIPLSSLISSKNRIFTSISKANINLIPQHNSRNKIHIYKIRIARP